MEEQTISDPEFRVTNTVQSVDRALTLLKLVATHKGSVSLEFLCSETGLNRTTVWRMMNSLETHGFVYRNAQTREYTLGFSSTSLFQDVYQRYAPFIRLSRPSMERMREISRETIILSVPYSSGILNIEQLDSPQNVRVKNYVDMVTPIANTSNGKVMFSRMGYEEQEALFQTPTKKYTPYTITDPDRLREEIAQVKRDGYGMVLGELDESENAISVAVDFRNKIYGFLTICGPSYRFFKEDMVSFSSLLLKESRAISDALSSAQGH